MTIIKQKAELRIAKKVDRWDEANVRLNQGKESILNKKYAIMPHIKASGAQCKAFTIDEEKVYMPEILNIGPADAKFTTHCNYFWQSIYETFDDFGRNFDISFEVEDDKVEQFKSAPENQKYKYGRPINILDYLLYRYCLEWSAVANSYSIYQEKKHAKNIRYYFHTEKEVRAEQTKAVNLKTKAMQAYLKTLEADTIAEGVLRYFERSKTSGVDTENIGKVFVYEELDSDARMKMLLHISETAPSKFIELVEDPNVASRIFIYKAMEANVISQLAGSSMIMFGDEVVGRNMAEAITALKTRPELLNDIKLRVKANQRSAD